MDQTVRDTDRVRQQGWWLVESVGGRMRQIRQSRGWTITQAADRAGLAVGVWGSYERGFRAMPLPTLVAVTEGLGIGIADLFPAEPKDGDRMSDVDTALLEQALTEALEALRSRRRIVK